MLVLVNNHNRMPKDHKDLKQVKHKQLLFLPIEHFVHTQSNKKNFYFPLLYCFKADFLHRASMLQPYE